MPAEGEEVHQPLHHLPRRNTSERKTTMINSPGGV